MSGEAARILNAGEAVKPQPVNKLPTAALLTLVQKLNFLINTCVLFEMYITRGPKIFMYKLV